MDPRVTLPNDQNVAEASNINHDLKQTNHELQPQGSPGAAVGPSEEADRIAQPPTLPHSTPTSPRGSAPYFTTSSPSVSSLSVPTSFTDPSARKVPLYKRLTNIFRRPFEDSSNAFLTPTYGPRVRQRVRSLSDYPPGYGKLAAIEACHPDFLIHRKFLWLHNRLLLHKQDELYELEQSLERLDQSDSMTDRRRLQSRRRDAQLQPAPREQLLKKIDGKLAEYDALLLRLQQVQAIKQPTERNQSSLAHLIATTDSQLTSEWDWIFMGPDLAAIADTEDYGWLQDLFENVMNKISSRATMAIFRNREQAIQTGGVEKLVLLSQSRIDAVIRIFSTVIAAFLLLVPVYILYHLQPLDPTQVKSRSLAQFCTIFGFTLLFSLVVSIVTKARRHEVFAATVAYSAVLVVFLSNTTNTLSSKP